MSLTIIVSVNGMDVFPLKGISIIVIVITGSQRSIQRGGGGTQAAIPSSLSELFFN